MLLILFRSNFLANISTDINHNRKVCDCRSLCATNENYSETQMVAFRKICEVLFELKDADDLTLEGFPLLTQFNVNVLCLLKQIFEQVRRYLVEFYEYKYKCLEMN